MTNSSTVKKILIVFCSLIGLASLAIAQSSTAGLQTNQTVKVPGALASKMNESATKRALAYLALEQYLNEYLTPNKVDDQKQLKTWIKQISRKRFEALVPSWSVQPKTQSEADVNLVVSKSVLESDIERSPFPALIEQFFPNSSYARMGSVTKMPVATFLFDESSNEVFIYPALESESYVSKRLKVTTVPFRAEKVYGENDVNSLAVGLAERAVRYTSALKKTFPKQSLELDGRWAATAFKAVDIAISAVDSTVNNTTQRWPLPLSTINANLPANGGAVFIFTVRSADKAGVLEKVDFLKFGEKHPTRTFWTRHLHDPTYKEQPAKIFERVYAYYQKSSSFKAPDPVQSAIKLIIDRRVSDKDVAALESILKSFAKGADITMMPVEVTRDDFRYSTPVDPSNIERVASKINVDLSHLFARIVPSADKNQLQIVVKSTPN